MDSLAKIWNEVLEKFRTIVNDEHAFNHIFKELKLYSLEKNKAIVTTSSDFYIAMAQQYTSDFESLLAECSGHAYHIEFKNENNLIIPKKDEDDKIQIEDNLIDKFTFDTFVEDLLIKLPMLQVMLFHKIREKKFIILYLFMGTPV